MDAQLADPVTNNMIQYLKFGTLPVKAREQRLVILREYSIFLFQDILYHLTEDMTTTGRIAKQMTAKIWVPRSLQVKAVFLAHSNSGHCGSFKTLAFLRKQYAYKKAHEYIKNK